MYAVDSSSIYGKGNDQKERYTRAISKGEGEEKDVVVVTLIHKEIYDTISNNKKNQIPNRQYEAHFWTQQAIQGLLLHLLGLGLGLGCLDDGLLVVTRTPRLPAPALE